MLTNIESWRSRHETGIDDEITKLISHVDPGDSVEITLWEHEKRTFISMPWIEFMKLMHSLMFGKERSKHKFTGRPSQIKVGLRAIVRRPTGYTTKAMFFRNPYEKQEDVPLRFLRDALDRMLANDEPTVREISTNEPIAALFAECDQLDSLDHKQVLLYPQMLLEDIIDILSDSNYMITPRPRDRKLERLATMRNIFQLQVKFYRKEVVTVTTDWEEFFKILRTSTETPSATFPQSYIRGYKIRALLDGKCVAATKSDCSAELKPKEAQIYDYAMKLYYEKQASESGSGSKKPRKSHFSKAGEIR